MTTTRDPDRLLRAWLDLMPSEAPDRAIAAVLQAVETTRQARALPRIGPWRPPMNRLSLIAAVAVILVALVGGVYLLAGGRNAPVPVTPTLAPTVAPTPTGRAAVVPAPDALWGDWAAQVEAIPAIAQPAGRIQLAVDWQDGRTTWVQLSNGQTQALKSNPIASTADEITFRVQSSGPCTAGDVGRYRWSRSADGMFLTLSLVEDQCASRATTFARTWTRSLGAVNDGGPGVVLGTSPMTQVTLPRGQRLAASAGQQWQEIKTFGNAEPFQAFVVIGNPGGFGAPCSTSDTKKQSIPATTADFISYVEGLPGATLTKETTEIDGRPAIQFDYRIDSSVVCASGEIAALHPEDLSDPFVWSSIPGELQRMYIVQVNASTTFLLWYQGNSETERAVIDSIRFIETLPTP